MIELEAHGRPADLAVLELELAAPAVTDPDRTLHVRRQVVRIRGRRLLPRLRDEPLPLRVAAEESPDLVLTDLRMPAMDGNELLQRMRKAYPDVGIVIMTAFGTIRSAVEALREGAEDYLTKPIDVEELEHLVERILQKRKLVAESRILRERLGMPAARVDRHAAARR